MDDGWRRTKVRNIRDEISRLEWEREPSRAKLESAENWFHVFTEEPLRTMFSGSGFSWDVVYEQQPVVLVNLGAKRLGTSILHRKAIAAMFIVGLFTTAFNAARKWPWYCVIDDATHYTPAHIGPLLVESEGHHSLYFVLMHHLEFDRELQRSVDVACRTKFIFGSYDDKEAIERTRYLLDPFQCVQLFNNRVVRTWNLKPSPEPYGDTAAFQEHVFRHPWYGAPQEAPSPESPAKREVITRPIPPPPVGQGSHPKSQGSGTRSDRRGK